MVDKEDSGAVFTTEKAVFFSLGELDQEVTTKAVARWDKGSGAGCTRSPWNVEHETLLARVQYNDYDVEMEKYR